MEVCQWLQAGQDFTRKPRISSFTVKMLTRNAKVNFVQQAVTANSDYKQPLAQHQQDSLPNRRAVIFLARAMVKWGSQVKSDLQKKWTLIKVLNAYFHLLAEVSILAFRCWSAWTAVWYFESIISSVKFCLKCCPCAKEILMSSPVWL